MEGKGPKVKLGRNGPVTIPLRPISVTRLPAPTSLMRGTWGLRSPVSTCVTLGPAPRATSSSLQCKEGMLGSEVVGNSTVAGTFIELSSPTASSEFSLPPHSSDSGGISPSSRAISVSEMPSSSSSFPSFGEESVSMNGGWERPLGLSRGPGGWGLSANSIWVGDGGFVTSISGNVDRDRLSCTINILHFAFKFPDILHIIELDKSKVHPYSILLFSHEHVHQVSKAFEASSNVHLLNTSWHSRHIELQSETKIPNLPFSSHLVRKELPSLSPIAKIIGSRGTDERSTPSSSIPRRFLLILNNFIGHPRFYIPLVDDTSGLGLCNELVKALNVFGLNVDDVRGQGYDNGSNMKGKYKGVQKRFREINPSALYMSCACHSLNLTLSDMAHSSTKRWNILVNKVPKLTVKSLCNTRWESRIKSVKAIRFQAPEIRLALKELCKSCDDAKSKSEAESLISAIENFEFLLGMVKSTDIKFSSHYLPKSVVQNLNKFSSRVWMGQFLLFTQDLQNHQWADPREKSFIANSNLYP
ncbi:hypothetical protein LXL04_005036 [Taraxacum kok-saghyz]